MAAEKLTDKKIGRPTSYTTELASAICEHIIQGVSLRKICEMEGMPAMSTVCSWLASPTHKEFLEQYARAREVQAEILADEIVDIADDAAGNRTFLKMEHSKVRIETRKWIASKLLPKKYGSFKAIEVSGQVETQQTDLSGYTFEQLYALKYGKQPDAA